MQENLNKLTLIWVAVKKIYRRKKKRKHEEKRKGGTNPNSRIHPELLTREEHNSRISDQKSNQLYLWQELFQKHNYEVAEEIVMGEEVLTHRQWLKKMANEM